MANSVGDITVALWDDVSPPASPDDRNPRHKGCQNLTFGKMTAFKFSPVDGSAMLLHSAGKSLSGRTASRRTRPPS